MYSLGKVIYGNESTAQAALQRFIEQPVDREFLTANPAVSPFPKNKTTIANPVSVSGPATFKRGDKSTLEFLPCEADGWWIDRADHREQFPFKVSVRNVWTTARNIVLRAGSPHNYLRMVEHIVALKRGMGIDNIIVETDSGDPPLFDRSSMDLVEALNEAGVEELPAPAPLVTVREPVTIAGVRGDFITLAPAPRGETKLLMDVAVDFDSVLGQQRIQFEVTPKSFGHGAFARTNATRAQMFYTKTVGKIFADTRNLGYTRENILIHGRKSYVNPPRFTEDAPGKSLEAVWHRATLDLLAALSLIDTGRFVGSVWSYRAGHTLDCRLVTLLQLRDLLVPHVW